MKYIGILAAFSVATGAALLSGTGCGGSSSTTSTTGAGGSASHSTGTATMSTTSTMTSTTTTTTGSGGSMNPAPPKIGATQIDRMGRPTINTALNHTFDNNAMTKGAAKDTYNADTDPTKWGGYKAEFAKNLAILDSLDTVCGNQILAGAMPVAGRYDTLAGALTNDVLYIKTDAAACTTFLAVEANATMLLANTDCGGRKLTYDVVDTITRRRPSACSPA